MDDNKVPYIVYEGEAARHERNIRRLVVALIATIAMLFVSNVAWLWFFNQFDIVGDAVTLESHEEGNANYMGDGASGVIDNGRSGSQTD